MKNFFSRDYYNTSRKYVILELIFGFCSNHATFHHLHRIFDLITTSLDTKKILFSCILDVVQAFESVCRIGLQYKLKKYFPLLIIFYLNLTFTNNCLQNRSFKVKLNHHDDYDILAGIPQGSDIAPFFIQLFIYLFFLHCSSKRPQGLS